MSDILIKGMEMPKNCRTCPMLFDGHNYRWCNITGESLGIEETDNGRDEHCPLVEIPTPHGRLVDLDQMIEDYWDGSAMRIDETDLKEIEKYDVTIEAEDRT